MAVKGEIREDNVPLVAAGMAFYGMLSIPPALAALVSLYGLVADAGTVERQIEAVSRALPEEARGIIAEQMRQIGRASSGGLTLSLVASVAGLLWAVSTGVKSLLRAMSIAYGSPERRGFLRARGVSIAASLGAIVVVVLSVGAIAVVPRLLGIVGLGGFGRELVAWGRWPALGLLIVGGLTLLYRYGPYRRRPSWNWAWVGAAAAAVLWLAASILFSVYVSSLGGYNQTYGALGAIVVLLLWLFISSFVVLFGAELNAEIEREIGPTTAVDPGGEVPPEGSLPPAKGS